MRIVAGKLGGLQFESPKSYKTHPMSEKMRGALFNVLGDVSDLAVFDAYGGSGAITFEAISRGVSQATICEIDRDAINVIEKNIAVLHISNQVKLFKQNSANWVEANPDKLFDLVICDPPYNDIKQSQLTKLSNSVKLQGLLVLSLPSKQDSFSFDGFELALKKQYGDSSLVFYRKS